MRACGQYTKWPGRQLDLNQGYETTVFFIGRPGYFIEPASRLARPSGNLSFACRPGFELRLLGRSRQRRGGRLSTFDGLGHGVEIAGAHFTLVLDRGKAKFGRRKLLLLQLDEGTHLATCVAVCQLEHAVVQGM